MRIEQLEYLAAIHEYHSMNLAGEKIHVSQQAISVAIRQLEEEFGVTIPDNAAEKLSTVGDAIAYIEESLANKA